MNIKILSKNISNNGNDFTPEQIEKYFQDYAVHEMNNIVDLIKTTPNDMELGKKIRERVIL